MAIGSHTSPQHDSLFLDLVQTSGDYILAPKHSNDVHILEYVKHTDCKQKYKHDKNWTSSQQQIKLENIPTYTTCKPVYGIKAQWGCQTDLKL